MRGSKAPAACRLLVAWLGLCVACGDDEHGARDPDAAGGTDAAAEVADGSASVDAAVAECGGGVEVTPLPGPGDVAGSVVDGAGELVSPGCGGEGAEALYSITVDVPTALEVTVDAGGTTIDPVLYLRGDCLAPDSEIACHGGTAGSLLIERVEPGTYYLVVDSAGSGAGGDFALSVATYTPAGEACAIGASSCLPDQICEVSGPGAAACRRQECDPLWTPDLRMTRLFGEVLQAHHLESSCRADEGAAESVYRFEVDQVLTELRVQVVGAVSETPTLSLRAAECGDPTAEVACSTAGGPLVIANPGPGTYYLVIEGNAGDTFNVLLRASLAVGESCTRALAVPCTEGAACSFAGDVCVTGQCSDGLDTDGDGAVDYPFEPGCDSADDPDEFDACPFQGAICACVDGIDNDGDGPADYPADADCQSAADRLEGGPACSNQTDDDGDGWIDYRQDPGCTDDLDTSEADDCPDGPMCPDCADGIDNDGDGLTDYPWDPGCLDLYMNIEVDPPCPAGFCPNCSNGIDDDYNGLADYPADPGCAASAGWEGTYFPLFDPHLLPVTGPVLAGTTVGATNDWNFEYENFCYNGETNDYSAPDVVYWLRSAGRLRRLTTDSSASTLPIIVGVFDGERWRNKDCETWSGDFITESFIEHPDAFIVIDGQGDGAGEYLVSVHGVIVAGEGCDQSQIASGLLECVAPTSCQEGICQ